ncbi:Beta-lactamase [Halomonadaceae bacterium LMG 33818]|uniref:class A beta-lactamase n=1 Tax=Cernens ardua TaxID=3402176 RepID=UPI003EDC61C1
MKGTPLFAFLKIIPFMLLSLGMNAHDAYAADPLKQAALQTEHDLHAYVGYFVLDTGNQKTWHYHADHRFLLTSTFKVLACSDLLHQQEEGHLSMRQTVIVHPHDVLSYAPVTRHFIGRPMSFTQLCQAGIQLSDNTAGNLILQKIGGPQGLTHYIRALGDHSTRLDRTEPSLNNKDHAGQRDTTTPQAIVFTLDRLVHGGALNADSRHQILSWMEGNKVTGTLLRAGLPSSWKIADKSGSGNDGARGVIAVVWPPQHAPVLVAFYMRGSHAPLARLDAAIAHWASQLVPLFNQPLIDQFSAQANG